MPNTVPILPGQSQQPESHQDRATGEHADTEPFRPNKLDEHQRVFVPTAPTAATATSTAGATHKAGVQLLLQRVQDAANAFEAYRKVSQLIWIKCFTP